MQDVVISEESLSAHESMKARMALTGVQLDPLPFRRGVQRLVKLNFPNGSKIHHVPMLAQPEVPRPHRFCQSAAAASTSEKGS